MTRKPTEDKAVNELEFTDNYFDVQKVNSMIEYYENKNVERGTLAYFKLSLLRTLKGMITNSDNKNYDLLRWEAFGQIIEETKKENNKNE